MSLIADALQKTSGSSGTPPRPPLRSLWIYRAFLGGVVGIVLAGIGIVTHSARRGAALPPTGNASPPATSGIRLLRQVDRDLSLNGIIRGGDGKSLALINNQVLEEGDSFQESKIVRIDTGQIQMEKDGQIKTLKLED